MEVVFDRCGVSTSLLYLPRILQFIPVVLVVVISCAFALLEYFVVRGFNSSNQHLPVPPHALLQKGMLLNHTLSETLQVLGLYLGVLYNFLKRYDHLVRDVGPLSLVHTLSQGHYTVDTQRLGTKL